jgi:rhamnulokinase
MATAHLAFDLGASSGRAIIGVLEGTPLRLSMAELHRFEHLPCPTPSGPVWDLTGIWLHLLTGLKRGSQWCRQHQVELKSVGVDAWGVDWCLLGRSGELLMLPHCYRDPLHEEACQRVLCRVGGREALYQRNGIQLMPINTLFQIVARLEREPKLFQVADQLVFVADLFHFWLSGKIGVERTIASTSAMLDLNSGHWDYLLLKELGIPQHLFREIIEPGETLGSLRPELAEAAGLTSPVQVISPASHDTAAAVAAVPAVEQGQSWAYLSSGTWSLLGVELNRPFISEESCAAPFTNERGVNQTIRFLKNIAGLWLIQELKRDLDLTGMSISFADLVAQARAAEPFLTLINPNDPRFALPGGMIKKLREFSTQTNQPVPETPGQLVRCCLESLAFCYRDTLDRLERILGTSIDRLHIVGGGTQNPLLNELTCAAVQRTVICGPVEATAIGNLLVQARGCGLIQDQEELRGVVARSFQMQTYNPLALPKMEALPFARYQQLIP